MKETTASVDCGVGCNIKSRGVLGVKIFWLVSG